MELDFNKMGGLVPAIIQDNFTKKVLMLGFMNQEALDKTIETGKVTFFSRTKNRCGQRVRKVAISSMLYPLKKIVTRTHCLSR